MALRDNIRVLLFCYENLYIYSLPSLLHNAKYLALR